MYLQFTILLFIVNCLLHANTSPPSGVLPFGCAECQKNGYTYCYSTSAYQFCAVTAAYCLTTATNQIVTTCGTSLAPTVCADFNHNCAGCVGSALGCELCITNSDFCIKTGSLVGCYGVPLTAASTCAATTASTAAMACTAYTSCSSCFANSCVWNPLDGQYNTVGCSSKTNANSVASCSDPVAVCAGLGGSFETRCNCTSNPDCGVCYGISDTYTNYYCSYQQTSSSCQSSIFANCNAPQLICPILIDPSDPYGTVCQCSANPACTICVTTTANSFVTPQLKCLATAAGSIPANTCQSTTTSCTDKTIICQKQVGCSACRSAGCTWCDTDDTSASSLCRAPSDTCSNGTYAITTCNTCSTSTNCASCNSNPGCQWCYSGDSGKSACLSSCPTSSTNKQQAITNCAQADPCAQLTCAQCIATKNCTYCEGVTTFDGRNPGFYCTKLPQCGRPAGGCGFTYTCVADIVTNCSVTAICPAYKDCISCNARADPINTCTWCSNNGVGYCDFACSPGVTVSSCTVYGATSTTGWPVYTPPPTPSGGSGSPGTPGGSSTPGGTTPSGSGTTPGGSGTTPGGSGTTPGGSGTTPGGSGTTPGGSGTTPGGSGTTPGGSGTTPGGSGNTPGGSGTTPGGSGNTPGGSGNTPGGSGNTPGGSGNTPGGSGNTPGGSGNTPGGSGNTPGGSGTSPGGTPPNGSTTTGSNSGSMYLSLGWVAMIYFVLQRDYRGWGGRY